jgi:hypothetical protein
VLDARASHHRVLPPDVDEAGAVPVGARGDRAGELAVLERRAQLDDLAALDVRAQLDDQVGVTPERLGRRQGDAGSARQLCDLPAGPRREGWNGSFAVGIAQNIRRPFVSSWTFPRNRDERDGTGPWPSESRQRSAARS